MNALEQYIEEHGCEPQFFDTPRPIDIPIEMVPSEDAPEEEPDFSKIFYEDKNGEPKINYGEFVDRYAELNKCLFSNGVFYTPEGMMTCEEVRKDISETIRDFGWTDKLDAPTNSIFNSLCDMYYSDKIKARPNIIPFANGDLHLDEMRMYQDKKHTPYRLSTKYTPEFRLTTNFDKWLHDLFYDEDIPTVQEMLGYVLVPTTAAQEAFIIVGGGGAGKSVLGTVLEALLGQAYQPINTQELAEDRFQIAELENKLVAYDDDLGSAALKETGTLKKLITADQSLKAERKYQRPFSFKPYCKVVACTNIMLSSLYDDTDGFFRRLHPICVKPVPADRKVIRNFGRMVAEEREGITRWALKGLLRLMDNNWQITWSDRSREYFTTIKKAANHFEDFSEEVFDADPDGTVTCSELEKVYARWCKANAIQSRSSRKLFQWFSTESGLRHDQNVLRGGKGVRGYYGMKIKPEWQA